MKRTFPLSILGLAAICCSIALATDDTKPRTPAAPPSKDVKPAMPADQQPPLPPGWTAEDMQACMQAGTPGKMHAVLAESVGEWTGKNTMWMAPGVEPMKSDASAKITSIMDGRFVKCKTTGDMMGQPFHGEGVYGYDNVTQKFQCTWIDNCGTGMMTGTGELSSDGKTMTWTYNYTCPITKKPTTMREVQKSTGKDSKTIEMYSTDPKSGKEFKMIEMALTRKAGSDKMTEAHN